MLEQLEPIYEIPEINLTENMTEAYNKLHKAGELENRDAMWWRMALFGDICSCNIKILHRAKNDLSKSLISSSSKKVETLSRTFPTYS